MTISDLTVEVIWESQTWREQRILFLRRFTDGDYYAFLKGHPMCPVKIGRIPEMLVRGPAGTVAPGS